MSCSHQWESNGEEQEVALMEEDGKQKKTITNTNGHEAVWRVTATMTELELRELLIYWRRHQTGAISAQVIADKEEQCRQKEEEEKQEDQESVGAPGGNRAPEAAKEEEQQAAPPAPRRTPVAVPSPEAEAAEQEEAELQALQEAALMGEVDNVNKVLLLERITEVTKKRAQDQINTLEDIVALEMPEWNQRAVSYILDKMEIVGESLVIEARTKRQMM